MSKPNQKAGDEHSVHVFVYGSLKKSLSNNELLRHIGAKFIGYDTISGPLTMISYGGFPAVCHDSTIVDRRTSGIIFGQIYKIKPETLDNLDALENHPRWYRREKMLTDVKSIRAWIYLMPQSELANNKPVKQNMWQLADEERSYWYTEHSVEFAA